MKTVTNLTILLTVLCLIEIAWGIDREGAIAEKQGRVFIKNKKQSKFLIIDLLSDYLEPRAMIWNVPDAIPPRGGAWWYLQKSPIKDAIDYNLVGGEEWNYTLCVSMLQPDGEKSYHYLHGYIDSFHWEAPECRWQISLTFDNQNFWISNRLYGGHMLAADHSYNIDPLRRYVFQALQVKGEDDNESWQIDRVLSPNDKPYEEEEEED